MAEITVGSKTLDIDASITTEAAAAMKQAYDLEDCDTPSEILDAWSVKIIDRARNDILNGMRMAAEQSAMMVVGDAAVADAEGKLVVR